MTEKKPSKKFYYPLLRSLLLLAFGVFLLTATPNVALAYDFKEGAEDVLELVKIVLLIVIIVVAANAFFAREIGRTILLAVVGAVLIAVSEMDKIKSIGTSIINLVTGS